MESSLTQASLTGMVRKFRLKELKALLAYANRSTCGKKQDLMERAIDLVKAPSLPIQMRVQDLYKTMLKEKRQFFNPDEFSPKAIPNMSSVKHTSPATFADSSSYAPASHSNARKDYNFRPDVRLKTLPFYELMAVITHPISLSARQVPSMQSTNFDFTIPAPYSDLRSRSLYQVQMRFCLQETTSEQNDKIPPRLTVKVNGVEPTLPPWKPVRPGQEPQREPRPVNVTSICQFDFHYKNKAEIHWYQIDANSIFCVAVSIVRQQDSQTLLSILKDKGARHADISRVLVRDKLRRDGDCEIATTTLKVSLFCPLSKVRIGVPCKGTTCTHLQCFDGLSFLQMNERKPTWVCPVCDKNLEYKDMLIDGLTLEILENCPQSCEQVIFSEDGSWSPTIKKEEKEVQKCSPAKTAPVVCNSKPAVAGTAPVPAPSKPAVEVIDLTLDSSEEDDEDEDDDEDSLSLPAPCRLAPTVRPNVTSTTRSPGECSVQTVSSTDREATPARSPLDVDGLSTPPVVSSTVSDIAVAANEQSSDSSSSSSSHSGNPIPSLVSSRAYGGGTNPYTENDASSSQPYTQPTFSNYYPRYQSYHTHRYHPYQMPTRPPGTTGETNLFDDNSLFYSFQGTNFTDRSIFDLLESSTFTQGSSMAPGIQPAIPMMPPSNGKLNSTRPPSWRDTAREMFLDD